MEVDGLDATASLLHSSDTSIGYVRYVCCRMNVSVAERQEGVARRWKH